MKIFLVRHADYEKTSGALKGRLPVKLSFLGIQQAKKLQEFFSQQKIEKIYSSAVERCKQTSQIISADKILIEYDKRLLEALVAYQGYMDGDWAEHAYSHQEELGGESIGDVQQRVVQFYHHLIKASLRQVIVCSHGDPLHFLYLYLCGKQLSNNYSQVGDSTLDYQAKASVRLIEVVDNKILKIEEVFRQPEY